MIEEIKTYEVTCDQCGEKEVHVTSDRDLPAGWKAVTNWPYIYHECPVCAGGMRTKKK